jgi:ABC-2 type transport system permease protein
MDLRKLRRDPTELLTRAIQPALWLLVFGQVFTHARAIDTGELPYEDFMAPGILAQSVLFIAIFYGISVIWERDLGIVHKLLVTPTPRTALVLGKGLSAGCRALAGVYYLFLGLAVGGQAQLASTGGGRRACRRCVGRCTVFHVFANYRVPGEDA